MDRTNEQRENLKQGFQHESRRPKIKTKIKMGTRH